MADLSNLSDDELEALHKQATSGTAALPSVPSTDLSKMSNDELQAAWQAAKQKPPEVSTASDIAKSAGIGLAKGAIGAVGFPGDISNLLAKGSKVSGDYIAGLFGIPPSPELARNKRILPTSSDIQGGIESQTGKFYEPQTTAGRYTQTAAEFAGNPLSYVGPGGLVAKGATAIGAGLGSEAAGEFGEKFAPESPRTQALLRFMGGIAGGTGATALPRIVTPNLIPATRQAMVATLDREGVPLTAGDRTGGTMLKATESELAPGRNEPQRQAFEQAAFNRAGEVIGDRPITGRTGAVNTMLNRIGAQFDGLSARNVVYRDPQLVTELHDIADQFNRAPGLYPPDVVNSINAGVDRVNTLFNQAGGGPLSGTDYQIARSDMRRAAQGTANSQHAEGLHEIVNALDDAMERTIQRTNPADAGAWAQARRNYQNALVLERWAGSANMTPSTLAQASKAVYGKRQYVRGFDDFSDLADAGKEVLKQYQDSGTARRLQVENYLKGISGLGGAIVGGGGGGALGGVTGGVEGGVLGLLLGENAAPFVARPLARFGVMNPASQAYLGGTLPWQAQYRLGTSPTMESLVNAIRGDQQPKDQKRLYVSPNRGQ